VYELSYRDDAAHGNAGQIGVMARLNSESHEASCEEPRFCRRVKGSPPADSVVQEILRYAWRTATLRMTPSKKEDSPCASMPG